MRGLDINMKKAKMTIDILMVVILLLLMAYSMVGENTHEVIGLGMFALFLVHHIINRKWWTSLFRGRYHPARVLNTIVNVILAAVMLLQPVSGVLMSKYVLKSVRIRGAGRLRSIHMTIAYWGFVLLAFHLGLHLRTITVSFRKKLGRGVATVILILTTVIAGYGAYAFIKRGIGDYLFMKVGFAFFDTGKSTVLFLLDYAAVMVLIAGIGYFIQNGLMKLQKRKGGK